LRQMLAQSLQRLGLAKRQHALYVAFDP
jgi:hypothetical protein